MFFENDNESINVVNIHSMMNDFSTHKVRNNKRIAFFQKALNFGEEIPVKDENSFGHNITVIFFFFQQLHGVYQANTEGSHQSHMVPRHLQGKRENPNLALALSKNEDSVMDFNRKVHNQRSMDVLHFPMGIPNMAVHK